MALCVGTLCLGSQPFSVHSVPLLRCRWSDMCARRWRRPVSLSRPWSASYGRVSWAPWSGTRKRSSSQSKPSNTWRYENYEFVFVFLWKLLVHGDRLVTSDFPCACCSNTARCWTPSRHKACLNSLCSWRSRSTATTTSTSWRPSRRLWCCSTKVCVVQKWRWFVKSQIFSLLLFLVFFKLKWSSEPFSIKL